MAASTVSSASVVSPVTIQPTCGVFADLAKSYPTWDALKTYLTSEEGGQLRVEDHATADSPFALIRYVKGRSDLTKFNVRAFRSVVWDIREHRPVSITPFKSVDGESLPPSSSAVGSLRVEEFRDGVMIGMFWDSYNRRWRIHTRSVLDANCRFYSQTKTFNTMFWEAFGFLTAATGFTPEHLDKTRSYTWVLQHPENRIVCHTALPNITCVEMTQCHVPDATRSEPFAPFKCVFETPADPRIAVRAYTLPTWDALRQKVADDDRRFHHNTQGYIVKDVAAGLRWKIRTPSYNAARILRGNSARRDFVWLSTWKEGRDAMFKYFRVFPEENREANALIERWKAATNDVFHIYVDAFKARTLDRKQIPPKYRPLVYGLHNEFMTRLKPEGKSVDWKAALAFMNGRDVAQMLFVLNWEARQAARELGIGAAIPIEPASTVATTVVVEDDAATVAAEPEESAASSPAAIVRSHAMAAPVVPGERTYAVAAGASPSAPRSSGPRIARGPPSGYPGPAYTPRHTAPRSGGGRGRPGPAFVAPAGGAGSSSSS